MTRRWAGLAAGAAVVVLTAGCQPFSSTTAGTGTAGGSGTAAPTAAAASSSSGGNCSGPTGHQSTSSPRSLTAHRLVADPGPVGLAIAPAGVPSAGTVYVSSRRSDSIVALDPATGARLAAARAVAPAQLVVAPAGVPGAGNLYVTDDGQSGLTIVAPGAASAAPVDVEQSSALGLAPPCTPNAGDVYVAGLSSGAISGFSPDGSNMLSGVPVGSSGSHALGSTIVVAPAGAAQPGMVYVGSGSGITTVGTEEAMTAHLDGLCSALLSAAFVVPRGAPGAGDVVLVCEAAGSARTGSAVVVNDGATSVLHRFALAAGTRAAGAAMAPAGLSTAGTVYVPDSTAGAVEVLHPDGTQSSIAVKPGVSAIAVAPAGTKDAGTVYAINGDTGELYVIAGTDGHVAATIPIGGGPAAVAVAGPGVPNAGTVYVASYTGGYVTALS